MADFRIKMRDRIRGASVNSVSLLSQNKRNLVDIEVQIPAERSTSSIRGNILSEMLSKVGRGQAPFVPPGF